jgi:GNAT superfamily N-acetyltransferase
MQPGLPDPPAGIVFRRLHTGVERDLAGSLLAAGGPSWRSSGPSPEWVWFGLWDLGPADGMGLVGAAATRLVTPRTVELCALAEPAAPPWRGLGDRLVREVADTLRAQGAEWMVARLPAGEGHGLTLLGDAGFTAVGRRRLDGYEPGSSGADADGVWLSLEL